MQTNFHGVFAFNGFYRNFAQLLELVEQSARPIANFMRKSETSIKIPLVEKVDFYNGAHKVLTT